MGVWLAQGLTRRSHLAANNCTVLVIFLANTTANGVQLTAICMSLREGKKEGEGGRGREREREREECLA